MEIHNNYLIVISVLFALIFAIMLLSLARHRRADDAPRRFGGPTGRVQWLWALVPMLILGVVNMALIERNGGADAHRNAVQEKVGLAAVHK